MKDDQAFIINILTNYKPVYYLLNIKHALY